MKLSFMDFSITLNNNIKPMGLSKNKLKNFFFFFKIFLNLINILKKNIMKLFTLYIHTSFSIFLLFFKVSNYYEKKKIYNYNFFIRTINNNFFGVNYFNFDSLNLNDYVLYSDFLKIKEKFNVYKNYKNYNEYFNAINYVNNIKSLVRRCNIKKRYL